MELKKSNNNFAFFPNNDEGNVNLKNSILILNNLKDSIDKGINQSVIDLVNCFICLAPAKDAVTCPKCNNFACRECFKKYFKYKTKASCPLCKGEIKLDELKTNAIVGGIENILFSKEAKDIKKEELENFLENKKKEWEDQTNNINAFVMRLIDYQENIRQYKTSLLDFMRSSMKLIEQTFEQYLQKTEQLMNNLLNFNKDADDSIKNVSIIAENNKKDNYYNEKNIKEVINDIFKMERKKFNEKNKSETSEFLNSEILVVPKINYYELPGGTIKPNEFGDINTKFKSYSYRVGSYEFQYTTKKDNIYTLDCKFSFIAKNKSNSCYFCSINKIVSNKNVKTVPLQLVKQEGNVYKYECEIVLDEFDIKEEIKMKGNIFICTI